MPVFNASKYSNAKFNSLIDKCQNHHHLEECRERDDNSPHESNERRNREWKEWKELQDFKSKEMLEELISLRNYIDECFASVYNVVESIPIQHVEMNESVEMDKNGEIEELKKSISLLRTELNILNRKTLKFDELKSDILSLSSKLEDIQSSSIPKSGLLPVIEKIRAVYEKKETLGEHIHVVDQEEGERESQKEVKAVQRKKKVVKD